MNVVTALGQDEKLRMVAVSLWAAFASALLSVSARLFERSFDARVLWMLAGFALALLLVRRAATWRLEVGSFCLCVLLWAVFTCGVLVWMLSSRSRSWS